MACAIYSDSRKFWVALRTWKKWQFKVFICCCSLNCYRNLCAVIYTTHMFSHQNNQLLHVHDKSCLVSHWPAAFQFEILMTTFVELRVVAGRSRNWAGRPQAVSRRPMLIHTCHAEPMPPSCCAVPWPWEVAFRTAWSEHGRGAAWAWYGMCESNTSTLCKWNGKDTI